MNEAEKAQIDRATPKYHYVQTAGIGWEVFKDGSAICTSISYSDNWTGERNFVGQIVQLRAIKP